MAKISLESTDSVGALSRLDKVGGEITGKIRAVLTDLPDDVLYLIFDFCDIKSLGRLCRVCKKLQMLVQTDSVWLKYSRKSLIIGSSDPINKRNRRSIKDLCRISSRWIDKQYKETVLHRNGTRLLPWLQYVDRCLWISTKNVIRCFEVKDYGRPREKRGHSLTLPTSRHSHDVTKFVVKNNIAVSGCRDGSVYVFDSKNGQCIQTLYQLHDTDTQAVDFHDTCIISGSRDSTVKITSRDNSSNRRGAPVQAVLDMRERVWSLRLSPDNSCFSVGTAGCKGAPSLSTWDIERHCKIHNLGDYRFGAGVLDMKYDSPHILLSCGYDASLRMWDTRTAKCVAEWVEPYDYTLYSIQTDNQYTMVTGTAQHGMVRLWDRRTTEAIQMYFFSQKSPVFSVAFDSSRLFAALDLSINYLDFSLLNP